jgi:hypothetical protein
LNIQQNGVAGGNNLYPAGQSMPYFKSTYSALALTGTYAAQGQHSLDNQAEYCYGVGDCLIGSRYVTTSEGSRDDSDEGAHPYDIQVNEDGKVPSGVCAAGCTAGSTQISLGSLSYGGLGEGRFLIDKNPAKVINNGLLIGGTGQTYPFSQANFSGTAFAVSTFFLGTSPVAPQAHNMAPGTVTVAIVTTGLPGGYASNTASAPATSGVACVADTLPAGVMRASNFEMANYTVVDATHLSVSFNKPHGVAPTIAMGGLCGYGLEQTVDSVSGGGGTIRQVVPVVGSFSSTGVYYAANNAANTIGINGTSRFISYSAAITSISRTGNVVTATLGSPMSEDLSGLTLTISGVADASYNGNFAITTNSSTSFSYSSSGANSSSSGGTASLLTGGYNLYPMAEAMQVMNATTGAVDGGNLQLAPNLVAWAMNDPVEMPHFYLGINAGDTLYLNQTMPRPNYGTHLGNEILFSGNAGPDVIGMRVNNAVGSAAYFGNGGTLAAPQSALAVVGAWQNVLSAQAGEGNVFNITCNSHGCGKWDSNYNLFALQSNAGAGAYDTVNYNPASSNLNIYMDGAQFDFAPSGLSVPALKATTLTVGAGTAVSGGSGTGTQMATTTAAAKTSGDCAKWDGNGNVVDAGAACGTGSGGGGGAVSFSSVTAPHTTIYPVATANNGNALYGPGWSGFSSNAPSFGVLGDGSNSNVQGYAGFANGAGVQQSLTMQTWVPANFSPTVNVSFKFFTAATTGNVTWGVQAACVADGTNAASPTFGTAATVTTTAPTSANTVITSSAAAVVVPTCAAGSEVVYQVFRSTTDTAAATANLLAVGLQVTGSL